MATQAENLLKKMMKEKREDWKDIFPVKVESGAIHAANGQTILSANRTGGETPLSPAERDALVRFVAELLNKNKNKFPQFFDSYMRR